MQTTNRLSRAVAAFLLLAAVAVLPPDASRLAAAQSGAGTWTWLNPRPQGNNISAVDCAAGGVCYAAGWYGTVLETRDHGTTWAPLLSGTHADLSDISCPTATTCVVLSQATVRVTHDHGTHWSHFTAPVVDVLTHVACPSPSACYALGFDTTKECAVPNCQPRGPVYVLFVTTDGGRSWRSSHVGSTVYLGPVVCGAPRRCIAVGDKGTVYGTVNAGRSWARWSTIPSTAYLQAATCPTTRDIWVLRDWTGRRHPEIRHVDGLLWDRPESAQERLAISPLAALAVATVILYST